MHRARAHTHIQEYIFGHPIQDAVFIALAVSQWVVCVREGGGVDMTGWKVCILPRHSSYTHTHTHTHTHQVFTKNALKAGASLPVAIVAAGLELLRCMGVGVGVGVGGWCVFGFGVGVGVGGVNGCGCGCECKSGATPPPHTHTHAHAHTHTLHPIHGWD